MPSDAAKVSGQLAEPSGQVNGVVLHVMRAADNIGVKSILKKTFLASAMKSFSMIGTYFRAKTNFSCIRSLRACRITGQECWICAKSWYWSCVESKGKRYALTTCSGPKKSNNEWSVSTQSCLSRPAEIGQKLTVRLYLLSANLRHASSAIQIKATFSTKSVESCH